MAKIGINQLIMEQQKKINLLPPARQIKLRLEEKFRMLATIELVFLAVLASFCFLLALVALFYREQVRAADDLLIEKEDQAAIFSVEEIEKKIAAGNKLVAMIGGFAAGQAKVTKAAARVEAALPPGVYLTRLVYFSGKMNLEGYAPNRDMLAEFKRNLESQPGFSNLVFPADNWLAGENIDFNVNFEYNGGE